MRQDALVVATYGSFAELCIRYKDALTNIAMVVFDEPHVPDPDMCWLFNLIHDFKQRNPHILLRLVFSGGTMDCEFVNKLPLEVKKYLFNLCC